VRGRGKTVGGVVGERGRIRGRGVSADVVKSGVVGGRSEDGVNPVVQGASGEAGPGVRKRRFEEGVVKNSDSIEVVSVDGKGRVGEQCSNNNAIQFAM
jgi:hypothetical protein